MDYFLKRASEASTWGGIGQAVLGFGLAFKIDEAPAVAEALGGTAQAVASGIPWWMAGILGAGGLFQIFKSDGDRGF